MRSTGIPPLLETMHILQDDYFINMPSLMVEDARSAIELYANRWAV